MANNIPTAPDLSCPVVDTTDNSYYTSQQSILNVARKDKFRLILDIPDILKPYIKDSNRYCHGGNLDRLQFSIWGYVVPEVKIQIIEKPMWGQTLKFSGLARQSYQPLNINFSVDNKFDNYWILWKWLDIQNGEQTGHFDEKNLRPSSTGHVCGYSTIITIQALDEYESAVAQWEYIGAFITTIGGIDAKPRVS